MRELHLFSGAGGGILGGMLLGHTTFALSKLNLTAEKSSCNGSETESCPSSQSGTTFEPSTASPGADSLTLCAGGSHAKTLVAPEAEKESMENEAGYGVNSLVSLAKYDLDTHSWKTRQGSLDGGLEPFAGIWPEWGMILDGELYQQPSRVPHISESEFGYLPTPDASLGKFGAAASMDFVSCFRKMESGTRPSGAKIGSSLRWHPAFIQEWQRTGGELNPEWIEVLMGWWSGRSGCTRCALPAPGAPTG